MLRGLNRPAFLRKGPSLINKNIIKAPEEAMIDVAIITDCQWMLREKKAIKCGNEVPNTKDPTKYPKALPKPLSYQSAMIFIPTG